MVRLFFVVNTSNSSLSNYKWSADKTLAEYHGISFSHMGWTKTYYLNMESCKQIIGKIILVQICAVFSRLFFCTNWQNHGLNLCAHFRNILLTLAKSSILVQRIVGLVICIEQSWVKPSKLCFHSRYKIEHLVLLPWLLR